MIVGLEAIHRLTLIYRRLKPENILLTDTGILADNVSDDMKEISWWQILASIAQ